MSSLGYANTEFFSQKIISNLEAKPLLISPPGRTHYKSAETKDFHCFVALQFSGVFTEVPWSVLNGFGTSPCFYNRFLDGNFFFTGLKMSSFFFLLVFGRVEKFYPLLGAFGCVTGKNCKNNPAGLHKLPDKLPLRNDGLDITADWKEIPVTRNRCDFDATREINQLPKTIMYIIF